MKLPKIKFKKKELKLESLHKDAFNPNYFWSLSLIIFVVITILGSFLGVKFFRSVYFEDYKNVIEAGAPVAESMNINGLKRAILKRASVIEKDIPILPDPSTKNAVAPLQSSTSTSGAPKAP